MTRAAEAFNCFSNRKKRNEKGNNKEVGSFHILKSLSLCSAGGVSYIRQRGITGSDKERKKEKSGAIYISQEKQSKILFQLIPM